MGNVKLLYKTFKVYLLCSTIALIIAAPLFYYAMQKLYLQDIDDALLLYYKEFKYYHLPNFTTDNIASWNKYNRNIKINLFDSTITRDTFLYQNFYDALDNEVEPYRVFKSPVSIQQKPFTFFARIDLVETRDLIINITLVFLVLFILLLGIILIVANRLSGIIWKPFYNTLKKLEQFDLTQQQNFKPEQSNIAEFNSLNNSLVHLIQNNIAVYNQQKTFIENASHELQTPIAIIQSKLDLLMQHRHITEQQYIHLSTLENAIARISRVNKNLLLLAKIDNNQFADKETVNILLIINEIVELLNDFYTAKEITIAVNCLNPLEVSCNKTLAEILFTNLIVNAITYSQSNTNVNIEIANNIVTVSNTGGAPLAADKLFKRFQKASTQSSNNGLGLSIVKEICNRYQWQITYRFMLGKHIFTLQFN